MGSVVLAACAGTRRAAQPEPTIGTESGLVALFDPAGADLTLDQPLRLPYAVADRRGVLARDVPSDAEFTVTSPAGDEATTTVSSRRDGIPRPYYPVLFTPSAPGLHQISGQIDDRPVRGSFSVGTSEPKLALGDFLPLVSTPTIEDGLGVEPICTREPACPFHDVTLRAALGAGRPVALLVASPGNCSSSYCPPALELLIDASARYPDLEIVHAEIYSDADEASRLDDASTTPVVGALALDFEPSLLLADERGRLTARLDHVFDASELDDQLHGLFE